MNERIYSLQLFSQISYIFSHLFFRIVFCFVRFLFRFVLFMFPNIRRDVLMNEILLCVLLLIH